MVSASHALDRVLVLEMVRVTEAAAVAASKLIGRGDEKAADAAAVEAMRAALNTLEMDGTVVIGEGVVPHMPPGSLQGLQLVVPDIAEAHAQLVERGVEVSEIQALGSDENALRRGGTALDNVGFVFFRDPDGNGWAVQQISARGSVSPPAAATAEIG